MKVRARSVRRVVVLALAAFVFVFSGSALAANKLIVKDADGVNDKFVVSDKGYIGVNTTPITALNIVGDTVGGTQFRAWFTGTSAADSGAFMFLRSNSNGTNNMPLNSNKLGSFSFGSVDGTTLRPACAINAYATDSWSSTSTPSHFTFTTTPGGSTSQIERMRITKNGDVGIGTNVPSQKLDVNGGIRLNSTGEKPTCHSGIRGTFWLTQGTTDVLEICVQNSGSYEWRGITLN